MADRADSKPKVRHPFRRQVAGLFAAAAAVVLFLVAASYFGLGDDETPVSDIEQSGDHLIENPRYVAQSDDGRAVVISADWATPVEHDESRFQLSNVSARTRLLGIDEISITAESGVYHTEQRTVDLSGGVVLQDSAGQRISTDGITIDAKSLTLRAESGVRVEMSGLDIEAGDLLLLTGEADRRGVFSGGVRARYSPALASN